MAELVDATESKSVSERSVGSSPTLPTQKENIMKKRNKPTYHSPPKMKPYGADGDPYDPRERHIGTTRMQLEKELRNMVEEYDMADN